jgi:hypothetical protein
MSSMFSQPREVFDSALDQMSATLSYYLRMRFSALPQTLDVRITPESIIRLFSEARRNTAVAKVRLYRVAARILYSVIYLDSMAFERAFRDLLELGKVDKR